jgi:fibronectin type 3 domain-containing protein
MGTWVNDEIMNSGDVHWYRFTAAAGSSYQVQWNNLYEGDGNKYGQMQVSAFTSDGSSIFVDMEYGWSSPRLITGVTGTVYLKVTDNWGIGGDYAIRYYDPALLPPQATMTIDSVNAGPAPSISISWNSVSGITGYHLYRAESATGPWTTIANPTVNSYTDTTVTSNQTYYYKVSAYNGNGESTLSPVESDTTPAADPGTLLTMNTWVNGDITTTGDVHWYKFTAAAGSSYQVQWNDAFEGDGTKDTIIRVSAFTDDGSSIFVEAAFGWDSPKPVTGVSGTVYLKVQGNSSSSTGTYGIRYYDPALLPPQEPMTISSVTASPVPSIVVRWNSVPDITGYRLYRSTSEAGPWETPITDTSSTSYTDITVASGQTYYYKVSAYNGNGEGTKSSAVSDTTPGLDLGTLLTIDNWSDGEIITAGDVHWYKFTAAAGTSYQVQWNDSWGDGTKTITLYVSAFANDGSSIFVEAAFGWDSPKPVTGVSGTVYLKVQGSSSSSTGTYAIRVSVAP